MSLSAQWVKSAAQLELVGKVDFHNVVPLLQEGESWIRQTQSDDCLLSLAGLTHSNSAGIALMIGLHRAAEKQRKALAIIHVPEKLVSMIRLSSLDRLLQQKSSLRDEGAQNPQFG